MPSIPERRRELRELVLPILKKGEECEVAAGVTDYSTDNGLDKIGFQVQVKLGDEKTPATVERLDDLLDPQGGVREALDDISSARRVKRSSGHQTFPDGRVGATWTVEVQQ